VQEGCFAQSFFEEVCICAVIFTGGYILIWVSEPILSVFWLDFILQIAIIAADTGG
jgi:uncharacterized membrane protein YciS (DUF1049 family)